MSSVRMRTLIAAEDKRSENEGSQPTVQCVVSIERREVEEQLVTGFCRLR
jgi:hypothetical protein